MMKPLFSVIAMVSVLTCPLSAQNPSGNESGDRKLRGRLAWIVATGIPDDIDNPVTVQIGKDLKKVTLSKRSPSLPIKIPQSGIIRIVKQVPNPEHPDEPMWITLGQAKISEDVKKAMIILVPIQPKKGSSLIFHTTVKDLAGFRGGDSLYINLSKIEVAVRLGEKALKLNPGDIKVHSARGVTKPTNTPISYHYMHPVKKKWSLISASTVVIRPTRREICIFSWDTKFKRLNYHGVTFPVSRD
ncbi:MAG: hypothetical protein AB8F34_11205 [Akkermansiaceae bacterium]